MRGGGEDEGRGRGGEREGSRSSKMDKLCPQLQLVKSNHSM